MVFRACLILGFACLACAGTDRPPYVDTSSRAAGGTSGGSGSGDEPRGSSATSGASHAGGDDGDGIPGSYIKLEGAIDAVYDDKREVVYVTVEDGLLVTYDPARAKIVDSRQLGSRLQTVDISPDRSHLVVADDVYAGTEVWLHLVDLDTGEARHVNLPAESGESGTYSVLFIDDTHALETGTFAGSGWVPMRLVDFSDDSSEKITDVNQDAMLALSGDGSVVAFTESNNSGGPFGTYRVLDGKLTRGNADAFLYEVGVSRDGSELAIPTYRGLQVIDAEFGAIGALVDEDDRDVLAAVFNPTSDRLYVAWTGSADSNPSGSIDAYDALTLEPLGSLARRLDLPWNGNWGLGPGRLKPSADGTLLLVIVDEGLRVVPLPP